ncbi:TM41B protein, partial [Polypterus senegalus]
MVKKRSDKRQADSISAESSAHEKPCLRDEELITVCMHQRKKVFLKNFFPHILGKAYSEGGSARMSLLILVSIFLLAASVMYLVYQNFPELNEEEKEKIKIPKNMDDAKALGTVLSKYKDTYYTQVDKHREHLINYIIFLRITPFLPNWFINITSPVINVPLGVFFIGTFLGVAPPSFVAINAGTTLYKLATAGEAVSWNSLFILGILAVLSILPVCFRQKLQQKLE